MNPVIKGLSWLYGNAAGAKNTLYDRGLLRPLDCGTTVISVGNLTVGGTGKTPVVDFCVERLVALGYKPGIVCRSYRARRTDPGRVGGDDPALDGDEASWYARRHPKIPVWSGPVKRQTARDLVDNENVDVIVVDDGFQHRALRRDLDLVLLDATDPFSAYQPLPAGRAREGFGSLARADAVLLTKTNLAAPEHLEILKDRVRSLVDRPVFEFESALELPPGLPAGAVLAVSGIARPETFSRLLESVGRVPRALPFADHHPYTADDVARILAAAGDLPVVTTEKDAVKLRALWPKDLPLHVLPLRLRLMAPRAAGFDELLKRAFEKTMGRAL